MVNLTSFTLRNTSPENDTIGHLLDFFESTPHLREVRLHSATPTFGAQSGQLVQLACLKRMEITGIEPCSILLDHLLIPIGAELTTQVDSFGRIEDHLPRSFDNLRNLSNFTKIHSHADEHSAWMRFNGPNGQVHLELSRRGTYFSIDSLAMFDTSKTEQLEIIGNHYTSEDSFLQVLLPMQNLRTLTLSRCEGLHNFMDVLHITCPKLEELILIPYAGKEEFDIGRVIDMAAARAPRGGKLRIVRIIDGEDGLDPESILELRKYVLHVVDVECVNNGSDDDDGDQEGGFER